VWLCIAVAIGTTRTTDRSTGDLIMPATVTMLEVEFLTFCRGDALTEAEVRELGKWWRGYLRRCLAGEDELAPLVRAVIQGKADADDQTRRVVEAVQINRALIIEISVSFAERHEFAEFAADFEGIAARAEALL
jgi:hypothetical protein